MEVSPRIRCLIWLCAALAGLGLNAADPDPSRLRVLGATTFGGQNEVIVTFSHPLKGSAATNVAQFAVDEGATLTGVSWSTNRSSAVRLKINGATTSVRVDSMESAQGQMLGVPITIGVQSGPWMPADSGSVVYGWQETFTSNRLGAQWKIRAPGSETTVPPSWALTNGYFQANATTANPPQLKLRHHLLLERPGYGGSTQEILARIRWRGSLVDSNGGIELGVFPTNATASSVREGIHFRNSAGKATVSVNQVSIGAIVDQPLTLEEWYWMRLRVEASQPTPDQMQLKAKVWTADGTGPEPDVWNSWTAPMDLVLTNRFAGLGGYLGTTRGRGFDVDYVLIKAEGLPAIRVTPDGPLPAGVVISGRRVVPAGSTLLLQARASSTETVQYQWRADGLPLAGATQPALSIPNAADEHAGLYDVLVTTAAGSVTSAPVRIEVVGQPYYRADFEGDPGPEWSVRKADASSPLGERYLGPLKGSVFLTLPQAPADGTVLVVADVFPVGGWQGSNPDTDLFSDFRVLHGTKELFATTFCNRASARTGTEYSRFEYNFQNYPGDIGSAGFPPMYGASRVVSVTTTGVIGSTTTWYAQFPIQFQLGVKAGEVPVLEFRNLQGLQTPPVSPNQSFGLGHVGAAFVAADRVQFRFVDAVRAQNESAGSLTLQVERSGPLQAPGEVGLILEEETAFEGLDFRFKQRTVPFPAGQAVVDVNVPLIDDSIATGSRRFRARLVEPASGSTLGDQDSVTVVIGDDETGVRFRTNRVVAAESDGQFQLNVEVFGAAGDPRWFDLKLEDGSATEGFEGDFVLTKRRVIIAPGTTELELPVSVIQDSEKEAEESLRIRIVLSAEDLDSEFHVLDGFIVDDDVAPFVVDFRVLDAATLEVRFPTSLGKTYRIESSDTLATWVTLQDVGGQGGVSTVSIPMGSGQRFIRVVEN